MREGEGIEKRQEKEDWGVEGSVKWKERRRRRELICLNRGCD